MNPFIELVVFKAKTGVTIEQIKSAAEDVNTFLKKQDGFVSRNMGLSDEGIWYDILYWESREHVMNAMAKVSESSHCATFFGLIDEGNDKMVLFSSLMNFTRH